MEYTVRFGMMRGRGGASITVGDTVRVRVGDPVSALVGERGAGDPVVVIMWVPVGLRVGEPVCVGV